MNNYYLVVIDTTHIQPYIFGSNRLRENIGGSYLVSQATGALACEIARQVAPGVNLDQEGKILPSAIEEHPDQPAEVLYYGGGNFVCLFREHELALTFTRTLTRRSLQNSPGLQLMAIIRPYHWTDANNGLAKKIQETFYDLGRKKAARPVSSPLLGLGVTAACQSTGLPAADLTEKIEDDDSSVYPASDEILAKRAVVDVANRQLADQFRKVLDQASYRLKTSVQFPYDFDHLGRSQEDFSYLAIIHADGDGIGQRFLDLADAYDHDNRLYIKTVREMSANVRQAGITAMENALRRLVMAIDSDEKAIIHQTAAGEIARVNLHTGSDGIFLPVRPIVYGGDDMTLVCDGRLGIALAIAYQQEFEKATETTQFADGKGKATACAGVAVVKVHYPFSHAYNYAESLCKSAKEYRKDTLHGEGACLDWHFAVSGWITELKDMRDREYMTRSGSMTQRPLALNDNPNDELHSWKVVEQGINAFQGKGWWDRRSKVKALREVLRGGPDLVSAFLLKYNENEALPFVIHGHPDLESQGWSLNTCGYFDAIELVDWYIPLEAPNGN